MASKFVEVYVDEHEQIPAGCCLRFRTSGESRPVQRLRYAPDDGEEAVFTVEAALADGTTAAAFSVEVEDSSAGIATLIYGGAWGLRLTPVAGGASVAEPYLLLTRDSILP